MTDPRKPEQDDMDDLLLSALYRQGAEELPPSQLDQAILEQARKAARRRRWFALPKLAVAMTLVLGVVVALRVFDVAPPETTAMQPDASQEEHEVQQKPAVRSFVPQPADIQASGPLPAAPSKQGASPALEVESPRARMELMMRERAKRKIAEPVRPVCHADIPPADAAAIEWLRRIRDLRQRGELDRASCLQDLYRQRFPEPGQIKPPSVEE